MQDIVANVDDYEFYIEIALDKQLGAQPLPFAGMDKSGAAICHFFMADLCTRGQLCPFRHTRATDKAVVCKHWLRGLCKKGDSCEFLHEYDMTKMPECYFYSKFGECNNKECQYLHVDPESKVKDCAWYDRGFCKHGPNCRNRHVRRVICQNYLNGFCLDGKRCKFVHPKFEAPKIGGARTIPVCRICNTPGHKSTTCVRAKEGLVTGASTSGGQPHRPLEEVTCFKCGAKGHYANKCPKSTIYQMKMAAAEER